MEGQNESIKTLMSRYGEEERLVTVVKYVRRSCVIHKDLEVPAVSTEKKEHQSVKIEIVGWLYRSLVRGMGWYKIAWK